MVDFFFFKAKFICKALEKASLPFYAGSPQKKSEIVFLLLKKALAYTILTIEK